MPKLNWERKSDTYEIAWLDGKKVDASCLSVDAAADPSKGVQWCVWMDSGFAPTMDEAKDACEARAAQRLRQVLSNLGDTSSVATVEKVRDVVADAKKLAERRHHLACGYSSDFWAGRRDGHSDELTTLEKIEAALGERRPHPDDDYTPIDDELARGDAVVNHMCNLFGKRIKEAQLKDLYDALRQSVAEELAEHRVDILHSSAAELTKLKAEIRRAYVAMLASPFRKEAIDPEPYVRGDFGGIGQAVEMRIRADQAAFADGYVMIKELEASVQKLEAQLAEAKKAKGEGP